MAVKYHLTDDGPRQCDAKPGNCPKGSNEPHFTSLRVAQETLERRLAERYGALGDGGTDSQDLLAPVVIKPGSDREFRGSATLLERMGEPFDEESVTFCKTIIAGEIPEAVPGVVEGRFGTAVSMLHSIGCEQGYYAKVTKRFARSVAAVVGDGTVLDPLAGKGFLVKALREQGIKTIGTDDDSWGLSKGLEKMDAKAALRKYGNDITHLAISWAPYGSTIDAELVDMVREDFPHVTIINIGEWTGGCTGSEKFWDKVEYGEVDPDNPAYPKLDYPHWGGLHDVALVMRAKTAEELGAEARAME